jgi:hypothetical protein
VMRSAPAAVSSGFRLERIAGFAGLAFVLVVGAVNAIVGAMSPPGSDASANEITRFFTDHRTVLTATVGMVPVGVVALFLFLASSFPRFSTSSSEAAFWARFGAIGLVLVEVMFLGRMLFELILIANAETLADEPRLVETLWQLQNAATIMTGLALAVTLTGLSRAGRLSGLIPGWQHALGLGAALAFFIAAVAAVASLEGSAIGLLGLPAFVAWLAWLALTSLRFLRIEDQSA